jgi:hypothetical protein
MATTTTRVKKPRQPKARTKTTTSAAKTAANQRNAQKSTGPRTSEGKEKAKFNALKHGQTARSVLLPDEDPAALNALRCELLDDLQPHNSLEATLIVRIADDKWICERSEQAAAERVALRLRHEPLEQAKEEKEQALRLAENLFWNLSRPLPIDTPSSKTSLGEPPENDIAEHPAHPDRVRLALEGTLAGCDWLLDRWSELHNRLHYQDTWLPADAFKTVRLLGKHASNMDQDFDVARILMSSLTLIRAQDPKPDGKPVDWPLVLSGMLASFGLEGREYPISNLLRQFVSFTARLSQLPLAKLAPTSAEQAREWLHTVITAEFHRLQEIRAQLQAIADADAVGAPVRLWFETGPEGENSRRYILSHKRVLNRSIGVLITARTKSNAGEFDRADLEVFERANAGAGPVADVTPIFEVITGAPEPEERGAAAPLTPTVREPGGIGPATATAGAEPARCCADSNGGLADTCGDKRFLRNEANAERVCVRRTTAGSPSEARRMACCSPNSIDSDASGPVDDFVDFAKCGMFVEYETEKIPFHVRSSRTGRSPLDVGD